MKKGSSLFAKRRPQRGSKSDRPRRDAAAQPRTRRSAVSLRRDVGTGDHELVHPRCTRERDEDLQEVHQMVDAGEIDVAIDELRWLLTGCHDYIDAHQILGELSLADGDVRLARAHFGYAYDLGLRAMPDQDWRGTLPFRLSANRGFLMAAKGLALCLHNLGEADRAREVADRLIAFDPSDPLRVGAWLAQLSRETSEPAGDDAMQP
jgi:tetratricopeptide (TPR) repeat protein